jgi:hypothetical protein
MILGLPLYLYFKKPEGFRELIFNLCFVFYLCYFIYSILPVIGGRYIPEAMELTRLYRGGPFTHIMVFIYRNSNHLGGAFPSSHVGVAIIIVDRRLGLARPLDLSLCDHIFLKLCNCLLPLSLVQRCSFSAFFYGDWRLYLANYAHRKLQGGL